MFRKWRNVAWLALALIVAPIGSEAKPKAPRTVLDYFDLLPQRFFEVEYFGSNNKRRKWLKRGLTEFPLYNRSIIDLKNDYIRFPGDGAQRRLDVAVFRYRGQATVGVYNDWDAGELSFWRYKNGRLVDVTEQVLPMGFDGKNGYVLPRFGTTVRVFQRTGIFRIKPQMKPLYTLRWRGGHFYRQK
ncbi:MAG: hypothetical protein KY445_10095 [Armatimonadetes bacterium]|nr:hypothetical protein [Armatimonadota bacterium]